MEMWQIKSKEIQSLHCTMFRVYSGFSKMGRTLRDNNTRHNKQLSSMNAGSKINSKRAATNAAMSNWVYANVKA